VEGVTNSVWVLQKNSYNFVDITIFNNSGELFFNIENFTWSHCGISIEQLLKQLSSIRSTAYKIEKLDLTKVFK